MPRPIMRHIIRKFGFAPSYELLPGHYEYPVEVWARAGIRHGLDPALPEPFCAGRG
jgi:hypothetical protein